MPQENLSHIDDKVETIIPSRLIKITKWLFWITVILYIVHILVSYYLNWKFPSRDNNDLFLNMQWFSKVNIILGFSTLILLISSIISSFYSRTRISKISIWTIIIVTLFTIFGFQGKDLAITLKTQPTNCPICGRPFWSRGFFSRKKKEAKIIKTNSWNILKE